jgi:hypothetical protein
VVSLFGHLVRQLVRIKIVRVAPTGCAEDVAVSALLCSAIVAVVGIAAESCSSACLNMYQICRTLSQGSLAECVLDDECDARCRRLSTDSDRTSLGVAKHTRSAMPAWPYL